MKRILIIFIFVLILTGCQGDNTSMSEKIINVIDENCKQEGSCIISINDIVDFKWDRMVIFDVGGSNSDISKAIGVEYKYSIDLMSGIVLVYNQKIVYNERFPYNPEKPNKLWFRVINGPNEPNLWIFTPDVADLEGIKTESDGKYLYSIKPYKTSE